MRATVCVQCEKRGRLTPLPKGSAPNQKYCDACALERVRCSKAAYQASWRARNKRTFDRDESSQRAAAAFTSDYSRIIMSPEERQDGEDG